jgi:hypothetical protein
VVDLDAEFAARELLQDCTGYFNIVFFAHKPPLGIRRAGGCPDSFRFADGPARICD